MTDFSINEPELLPRFIQTEPFYYADKENLFFYIFSQEINSTHQFTSDVQMFGWSVDELIRVRRHHVLSNAKLSLTAELSERQRLRAHELIVANLLAQGDEDLATQLSQEMTQKKFSRELAARLDFELNASRTFKYAFGRELEVQGLAGLQYRIFYSTLLPAYAELGIERASEHLEEIRRSQLRSEAVADIKRIYAEPDHILALPIEV